MAEPVLVEDVLVNFIAGDERLMAVARALAKNVSSIQSEAEKLTLSSYFTKLTGEILHSSTAIQGLAPGKILGKASSDFQDILKSVKGITASSGMAKVQLAEMNSGIANAAAEIGEEFGTMATAMRDLYGSTGLKEGIGQTLLDSERLGQVFDTSGSSFSKLTANMVQFGEGAVTADDVMKSFDKTTGITGKRMDDMLDAITDINKTMRNVVGGGKQLGDSMKAIIGFSTQIAARFTEMGGDGAALNDLLKGVMDPNKWGDIAQKMPGMAGNLFAMQQAMASGDMKTFGELMRDGAEKTAQMGAGMSTIARAASGVDFTSAELLSKIPYDQIIKDAREQASITERSANLTRDLGSEWKKFANNMSKALMPAIELVIGGITKVLSFINRFMQMADGSVGTVVTYTILIAGAIGTAMMLMSKFAKVAVTMVGETAAEAGKGVGKAAGATVGGFMEAIGKAAANTAKFAIPMMQLGAALLLFAASVYVVSKALENLGGITSQAAMWSGVAAVLLLFAGFAVASVFLAPIAPILYLVGGAFIVFAAAVWIMAKAMQAGAEGFAVMGNTLSVLAGLPLFELAGGLIATAAALGVFLMVGMAWGTIGLVASAGLALFGSALSVFGNFGKDANLFADALKKIGDTTDNVAKLNSIDMSGITKLGNALGDFSKIKVDISFSSRANGISSLLETINRVQGVGGLLNDLGSLTTMGARFKAGEDGNLYAFADTVGTFMQKMHSAMSAPNLGDMSDLTAKMSNFGATLKEEVKISTKTGADLALTDHTAATAEHQQEVESLLTDIRDGINRMSNNQSPAAQQPRSAPVWQPDSMFTGAGGDSF